MGVATGTLACVRLPIRVPSGHARVVRVPAITGLAVAAVGIINIISALTPALHSRLRLLLTVASRAEVTAARAAALPLGAALLVAGWQLARGRRGAAGAAVAVLAVLGALDLAKGLDVEEAVLTWTLALGLWRTRTAFPVATPRSVPARAVVGASLALALLIGADAVSGHPWLALPAAVGGAVALSLAAGVALVPARSVVVGGDRRRAAAAVRAHGDDTLSAFKLRRDLQRRWHAGGRAFVGQREQSGALLVAGDPVGEPGAMGAALAAARDEARAHGLAFGVVAASEQCAAAGHAIGLCSAYMGDEALIATGPMTLSGNANKSLRKAVNRVARSWTAELHRVGDVGPDTLAELEAVSAAWRADATEFGFSMAHDALSDELLPDALIVLARDADGAIGGFLHFVPVFGRPVASLAFMRRDRSTPNGMMDFLVVRAAALLADCGIDEFSLNFAAFGRWLRAPEGVLERALGRVIRAFGRWTQFERLQRYNAKFGPRWEPRYLLFDGLGALPRIALAALWAEGQIPPLPGARRRRRDLEAA
jgi:lysyl-tRNA synthetase class 2